MNIQYIGPFDSIDVEGVGSVTRNQVISVSSAVAGHAPDARVEPAMLELREAIETLNHNRAVALREEIAGLDFGTGLLAQSTNWISAKADPKNKEPQS
jgi:hypothetical protein